MDAELEALVKALDAVVEARTGAEAERLESIYQSRLDDVIRRHGSISREQLVSLVSFAYRRWRAAQKKNYPTIPPKA